MVSPEPRAAALPRAVLLNYHEFPKRLPRAAQAVGELGFALLTDDVPAELAGQVTVIVNKTREIGERELRRFPALRGILVAGTEDWMVSFERRGSAVRVATMETDRGVDVAEHAVALMLVGLKRLHRLPRLDRRAPLRALRRVFFPRPATETTGAQNWAGVVTEAAYGKRVGILGYGLIGREIHKRLAGFGTTVHYHCSTPYSHAIEEHISATYLPLAEMVHGCDIVFVQLPLTERTSGLIGADVLSDCKPGLMLVNCGRAGVIDPDALYTALRTGRVAYYGADVFWREPRPLLDRFRWLRSCYVTPHMAGSLAVPQDFTAKLIDALKRFVQSDMS